MSLANHTLVEADEDGPRHETDQAYRHRHARLVDAGSYRSFLASGGMGALVVVAGFDQKAPSGAGREMPAREPVALKLLKNELLTDPAAAGRFRRELEAHRRLSRKLQVPRLIPCLRFHDDEQGALLYGAFPYYPDGSLDKYATSAAGVDELLRLLIDGVEGLQSLHGHDYLHRDFCPANIFVQREGRETRGLLGDLGVGVFLRENTIVSESQLKEDLGLRVGHVGYIDPWFAGTFAGDVFGVGACLYWVISGAGPRSIDEHRAPTLPPVGHCRVGVTSRIHQQAARMIARLTSADEKKRPASVRDAREELVRLFVELDAADARPRPRFRGFTIRGPKGTWGRAAAIVAVAGLMGVGIWQFDVGAPETLARPQSAGAADSSVPAEGNEPAGVPPDAATPAEGVVSSFGARPKAAETLPAQVGAAAAPAPALPSGEHSSESPIEPPVRSPNYEDRMREVESLLRDGLSGDAAHELEILLSQGTRDPDATSLLAVLWSAEGPEGLDRAIDLLTDTLDSYPTRGDIRLALARALAQRGDKRAALETLAAAHSATTHRREIELLRVTIVGSMGRSQ